MRKILANLGLLIKSKEFKQKYDDVFMFEPYDSTDFIAHYKLKGSTYSSFDE